MHYLRDELSRVTASSIRVSRKDWECSKLYDRDSTGNLTADDTQGKFFEPEELEQKRNGLLLVGRPQGPEDIGSHHVRHYEYDQAGNLIALFRGKATKAAGRWPQGTELVSSWNPFSSGPQPGAHRAPQARLTSSAFSESAGPERSVAVAAQPAASKEARLRALASNRPACKATVEEVHAPKARLAACYEYDRFGRLANYFSQATGKPLRWQIEYDLLGRVVWMKGFEADPANAPQAGEKSDTVKPGATKPACELRFAYDPFNRRIVKDVRKMANTGGPNTERTVHAMLYTGQRPAVKLRKPADPAKPWIIEGQYLWGAGPSEILAYYERADVASSASAKPMMREHLLHQDVGLNVVLSTHCSLDKSNNLEIGDVASYWGLGENSTTGVIREATSSLDVEKGHEARLAIDRTLDHQSAHWKGADKPESGFLTLKLAQKQRLMAMDVWADKLPSKFRVYVVPEGKGPRRKEEPLSTWENNHKRDKVWDTELARPVTPMKPHTLPLESREGQEIVLAWDSCPGGIQVREFEVFAQPLHPGDLAFSGTIYDAETGLYYHGARYRLPELGTFISPDPLGFFGGDNLYAFAHNDPLTWHDPDGRFAHILLGGGVGGAIGAVSYIWQWWWYGEEWDWARFGIHTAAGVASGALAATTGGASLAWMAGHGFSATSSVVMAGALSGGVGGAMHGAIQAGGITYLETGDLRASLRAAGAAALQQGILGAVGGFVGGGVLGQLGGNFRGFVASGIAGGAVPCGLSSAYEGYSSTGTIFGALRGFFSGAAQGAVVGGTIGAAAWGVGRTTGWIRPLPKQPKGLPDPRQGLLIRTEPKRGDYGGVAVKPGYARHHIKPLSLGGTDTPNNIVELPLEIHRQAHPGPEVNRAPIGTIFY
jgi:RHS repeat-associated protein